MDICNDFTFYATTIEEATKLLNSHAEQGFTNDEAKLRLEHFGLNTVDEAKAISPFTILINQFKSPINTGSKIFKTFST